MNFKNTTLIYFSPTHTTKTVLNEIAKGLGKDISDTDACKTIDITNPETRNQPSPEFKNELVIIGAPVYAGRLPKDAADYLKTIKASDSIAVLVALYGNRDFDDALLEMKNISIDCGFTPLAAAAFIGEHSFSTDDHQIAVNRPDEDDRKKAFLFGKQVADRLNPIENPKDIVPVDVPGNFPYKDGMAYPPASPIQVTDACDDCGICAAACPSNAIDETAKYATIHEKCILCCACIKACPQEARFIIDGPFKDKGINLSKSCAQRKEPQLFV